MTDLKLIFFICLAVLWLPHVQAQSMEEKGLEIAKAARAYNSGFGDFTADMLMILKTRTGETSSRIIRIKTKEVKGDGDKGGVGPGCRSESY